LSPLSCEHSFPFSHKSHCDCNLPLTLPSTHVWCRCKCCFCCVWRLKSQESSASVPCYAERQTDPFFMFIILHLFNLAWKFLSGRLCNSMLSEAGLSVNAMWPFLPLTSLPTHPLSSSPSKGHLTLPSPSPSFQCPH